jgi:hypothetical protein
MTITLSQDVEIRLKKEATRQGVDPEGYAASLIANALPKIETTDPTIALMRKWMEEEATDDPEELEKQRLEGEEFMQNLARNRIEMEGPNARKLWP